MKGLFPKSLLEVINAADGPVDGVYRFEACWIHLHVCRSIREFNAHVVAALAFYNQKHCFYAAEHHDWVHSFPSTTVQLLKKTSRTKALSSFILKDPVGLVPAEGELEQECVWRKSLMVLFPEGKVQQLEVEDLHHSYVGQVCRQMYDYEKYLQRWVSIGRPLSQEECLPETDEQKRDLHNSLKVQRMNVLDNKRKLELFIKTGAPECMIAEAAGQSLREKRIADQMATAIQMCS